MAGIRYRIQEGLWMETDNMGNILKELKRERAKFHRELWIPFIAAVMAGVIAALLS
jgi:hypothetical protein